MIRRSFSGSIREFERRTTRVFLVETLRSLSAAGDALPLPVKLGIHHEASRLKAASDRITRMERNLRRSFKGRERETVPFLNALYELPLERHVKPVM